VQTAHGAARIRVAGDVDGVERGRTVFESVLKSQLAIIAAEAEDVNKANADRIPV